MTMKSSSFPFKIVQSDVYGGRTLYRITGLPGKRSLPIPWMYTQYKQKFRLIGKVLFVNAGNVKPVSVEDMTVAEVTAMVAGKDPSSKLRFLAKNLAPKAWVKATPEQIVEYGRVKQALDKYAKKAAKEHFIQMRNNQVKHARAALKDLIHTEAVNPGLISQVADAITQFSRTEPWRALDLEAKSKLD